MRIPAAAVKPLVVLAVAAVSFGCITPAYAQDATATVTSDGSNHIFLVACLMLVLYELLELHDRHRL